MNYSKGDVILLPYPFTDLKVTKVRPAVVVATEDSRYWLDSTRITEELQWSPTISLEQGAQEMVDWAAANLDALRAMPQQFSLRS